MQYTASSVLLLFAAAFLMVWLPDRSRREVLLFCGAFLSYGLATVAQVAGLPADAGANALLTAALYATGVLLLHRGILVRSRRPAPLAVPAVTLTAVVAAVWYFHYVEQSLLLRVVALNIGLAWLFLQTAWHTRFLLGGAVRDRVLFWLLVGLTLHYIPRLLLTTAPLADTPGDSLALLTGSYFWTWAQYTLSVAGAAAGLVLLAITAADQMATIERERDRDPLTGLLNRRGLEAWLARRRAAGEAPRVAVLVCDVDRFKRINDTFGHLAGDRVLAAVARVIADTLPPGAAAGRVGGEEFVILAGETAVTEAFALAERLRLAVRSRRLAGLATKEPVTCSLGLAVMGQDEELWAAFDRADRLLYAAKRAGRDRTFAEGLQTPAA